MVKPPEFGTVLKKAYARRLLGESLASVGSFDQTNYLNCHAETLSEVGHQVVQLPKRLGDRPSATTRVIIATEMRGNEY